MKSSVGIIPVFVSHMGCPNHCTFCNQRKINGVVDAIEPEALFSYVEIYLKTMKRDQVELAFFGGSFTGIELKRQIAYLENAFKLKEQGFIHKIRLSTRPDYIDEDVIERLNRFSVDLVELGCQSFDETVLLSSQRGHEKESIYKAVALLKKANISFGIQLMLGLQNDSFEKFKQSVAQTISLNPTCVRLYPALVIRETQLEQDYYSGVFVPISLEKAIIWCAFALKLFYKSNIDVIRIGLQKTDLIDFDASVVAGPFHPAFGEMVLSYLFYDAIDLKLYQLNLFEDSVTIHVNPKQISAAIGNNKSNIKRLKEKYCEIKIVADTFVESYHFILEAGIHSVEDTIIK